MTLAHDGGYRGTAVSRFVEQCRQTLGAESAVTGDDTAAFAIDGQRPAAVCYPAHVNQLSLCVAAAADADLSLVPVGNGTQLQTGRSPLRYDVAVCTRRMSRVVAHEAADMTVTVEAGATIEELNRSLAGAAQFLPFDPSRPAEVTVGGLIAADACGPLRFEYGKVRDSLIGIRAVLADGTTVKGGGRVVKNVAGYDLMKLLTGSFGSLAVIAEATFKVRPLPEKEEVFVLAAETIESAVALGVRATAAHLRPAFIEAVNEHVGRSFELPGAAVVIGCHGSAREIEAQRREIEAAAVNGVEVLDAATAAALMGRLRNVPSLPGSAGCRIATSASRLASTLGHIADEARRRAIVAAIVAHVGNGAAVLRCQVERAGFGEFGDFARWLLGEICAEGGTVIFDALPATLKDRLDPWSTDRSITAGQLSLMRGIKEALDPRRLLSPGRFVGGL
jgi:glycolate oxidase FAD binding subunit